VSAARREPANIAFEDTIVLISDRAPQLSSELLQAARAVATRRINVDRLAESA
jgi:hypothetical protein